MAPPLREGCRWRRRRGGGCCGWPERWRSCSRRGAWASRRSSGSTRLRPRPGRARSRSPASRCRNRLRHAGHPAAQRRGGDAARALRRVAPRELFRHRHGWDRQYAARARGCDRTGDSSWIVLIAGAHAGHAGTTAPRLTDTGCAPSAGIPLFPLYVLFRTECGGHARRAQTTCHQIIF